MCPAPASRRLLKVISSDLSVLLFIRVPTSSAAPTSSMALQAKFKSVIAVLRSMAAASGPVFSILMPLEVRLSRCTEGLLPILPASTAAPSSHMWFFDRSSAVIVLFSASMRPSACAPRSRMVLSAKTSVRTDLLHCMALAMCSAPASPMQLPLRSKSVSVALAARPGARNSQPACAMRFLARPARLSGRPAASAAPSWWAPPPRTELKASSRCNKAACLVSERMSLAPAASSTKLQDMSSVVRVLFSSKASASATAPFSPMVLPLRTKVWRLLLCFNVAASLEADKSPTLLHVRSSVLMLSFSSKAAASLSTRLPMKLWAKSSSVRSTVPALIPSMVRTRSTFSSPMLAVSF
mmetsp:Transcript_67638/g.197970  ORF Transcript_67638/g.197970 Transcript_67638/m.197970 type:complete len:353 (-) Transcript_67638:96-1154(-)